MTGPLAQRRQRPRRRITPNTNTSTTTMISTHNHVDMAASLVGAGAGQADTTAAHPGKQLPRVQATSRAGIDGRAAGGRAEPLHPATCPPIRAGRAGAANLVPTSTGAAKAIGLVLPELDEFTVTKRDMLEVDRGPGRQVCRRTGLPARPPARRCRGRRRGRR